MRICALALVIVFLAGPAVPFAATQTAGVGSIVVRGRGVKAADRTRVPLARKRFFVFSGGLNDNKALLERIRTADVSSRNCFYAGLKASPCFISWLAAENCESPFCRVIKQEDIKGTPEFETAYAKGLAAHRTKPGLALSWILNELPPDLLGGFYRYQREMLTRILGAQKPVQSLMTTSGAEATFPGLSVTGKATKYLVTNLLPVEIDQKSYSWACEIDVPAGKPAALVLALPLDPKRRNCVLTERELKTCTAAACEKK